jgi:hypothetical protein
MTRAWATVRRESRTHGPQSGCAPAVRSSRSDKAARCVSRARRMTCPTAKHLHSGRSTKSTSPANGLRRASCSANRFSVRKPQGQRSPTTTVPRSSEERAGTSAKVPKRDSVSQTGNGDTQARDATDEALKGKQPQPAASPRPPAPHDPLGIVTRGNGRRAGHARCDCRRSQMSWSTRTRSPATAHARRIFDVLMLKSGSEIWVNASASTVRRIGCRTGKKPATSEI